MNTDQLISLLAIDVEVVDKNIINHSYLTAIALGTLVSVLMMGSLLGVRPDLAEATWQPMFWVKLGFVVCLALVGLFATLRLSRPGMPLKLVPIALIVPVLTMWLFAAIALLGADAGQRAVLIFGSTWLVCPSLIVMLSLPLFVAVILTMRGLAPTQLHLAGGAAGLLSGGLGALVYSLHCPEMAAPFVALWYLLGILTPALIGWVLGPRLLRW